MLHTQCGHTAECGLPLCACVPLACVYMMNCDSLITMATNAYLLSASGGVELVPFPAPRKERKEKGGGEGVDERENVVGMNVSTKGKYRHNQQEKGHIESACAHMLVRVTYFSPPEDLSDSFDSCGSGHTEFVGHIVQDGLEEGGRERGGGREEGGGRENGRNGG